MAVQELKTFLDRSHAVHGDRYDYSRVDYHGTKVKVEIICSLHGSFQQKPEKHYSGQGCPICGAATIRAKKTFSYADFIARSRDVHGDVYDYSVSVYKGSKFEVDIRCRIHGVFSQVVEYHWQGNGCPSCGLAKRAASVTLSTEDVLGRLRAVHGDRYGYSKLRYAGNRNRITATCPDHGDFQIRADHHMAGSGCFVCGAEKRSSSQVLNLEHFLARSRQEHGSRYDYSRAIYKGAKDKVEIICRKHGSFWQAAESHYTAGSGCPSCKSHYTKPQKEVEAFLKELGCEFAANTRSVISPRELDIYIPGHQLAIELNGTYWHSLTAKTIKFRRYRHRDKYRLCAEQGIQLLQIDEHEWRREVTRNIWKSIIASKLRKQTTVFARQTSFRSISLSEANVFLAIHHIQGATAPSRWCFGLFHKEVLVGVITFCEHQKTQLNLVRMAFAKNVTVVGGANKLFRNSLQHLPERDIVTFSNNRYSDGSVYGVLGFEKVANLSPSYQWFFKGKIWNKRHMRHKHLPVLLGEGYNPAETEQENMLRNGARCLYDAGYQKYVFRKIRTTRIHNESTSISEV